MKKYLSAATVVLTMLSVTACGSNDQPPQPGLDASALFKFDQATTAESVDYLVNNDSIDILMASSPYYMGAKKSDQPLAQEFDALKQAKVTDAQNLTKDLFDLSKQLKEKLVPFKQALAIAIGTALPQEKKLTAFAKRNATDLASFYAKENILIAQYEAEDNETTKSAFVTSFIAYHKTSLALNLAETVYQDLGSVLSNSSQFSLALETTSSSEIKGALSTLEQKMQAIENLNETITTINKKIADLQADLKAISAGEYYLGMASLAFIQDKIPDIQAKADQLTPREGMTTEDIQFIQGYSKLLGAFSAELKNSFASMGTDSFTFESYSSHENWLPKAYAENNDYWGKAKGALQSGASVAGSIVKLTWKGAKDTVKGARTAAGVGIDILDATVSSTAHGLDALYHGDNLSETASAIGKNFRQIKINYDKGISGSKVLYTAGAYLNAVDDAAEDVARTGAEYYVGKGWTSWGIGKTAKLTSDIFTTLGKGIYKVSNTQATPGETAEGLIDIALSFVGGSKAIVKGSQAAAGLRDSALLVGENGLNFLQRAKNYLNVERLKTLRAEFLERTGKDITDALRNISNTIELQEGEALAQLLNAVAKDINKRLGLLVKDGASTIWDNLTNGVKNSYIDFVRGTEGNSIKEILQTIAEGLQGRSGTLGGTAKEYFDNLVGDAIDNTVKGIIKKFVDENYIGTPELSDLAGTWDAGQLTITDVILTEKARQDAKDQGCDAAILEKEKGKVQPVGITLTPISDQGGTMTLKTADGKSKIIPIRYVDGEITGSYEEKDTTVNIHMKVVRQDDKFKLSGGMDINYQGDNIKMTADTSASKSIPLPPPVTPQP